MKSAELENLVRVKLLSHEAPLPGEIEKALEEADDLLADEIEETPDLPKQVCDLAQRIGPLVADTAQQNQRPSQASTADPAP